MLKSSVVSQDLWFVQIRDSTGYIALGKSLKQVDLKHESVRYRFGLYT